jgi:arabinofuranosyltransferase
VNAPPPAPLTRFERASLGLALALTLVLLVPLRHYITDDTFIHLQYARRLAEGHGLVFNVGERVYGCTSPFWVALLAAGMALGLPGLAVARALGLIATLGSVVLFFLLVRRTLATPAFRGLATVAWAGHAWMLRWAVSGMETPLAVALVLAGFLSFSSRRGDARPALTGTLWALAALTRPEAAFLVALWGALLIADSRGRPAARWIAGVMPPLLIYGGWLLFAKSYYGSPWPQTLAAKTVGAVGLEFQLSNLWRQIRIVGATDGLLAAVLAAALLVTRGRVAVGEGPAPARVLWLLPWAWLVGVPVLYAARGVPVLSRYLLPLLPVLGWQAWRAAERWWIGTHADPARGRRALALASVLAAAVLAQNAFVYGAEVVPHVRTFSAGLERSLVQWGRWFGANAPPDAAIATPDIGAIGYFSGLRVVDLAGLVTPQIVPLLERESPEDLVSRLSFAGFTRPEFVVDRAPAANDLLQRSPYAKCLTPLGHASVPNLGITRPGEAVYTFYRVEWDCYEASRPRR